MVFDAGLAGLVAGRLVLAAQHEELAGADALPISLPRGVIGIAVGLKLELRAVQTLAAKA